MGNPDAANLARMYLALAQEYCADAEYATALKSAKAAVVELEQLAKQEQETHHASN